MCVTQAIFWSVKDPENPLPTEEEPRTEEKKYPPWKVHYVGLNQKLCQASTTS